MPIDNYDALDADQVRVRLPDLTEEQLRVVRSPRTIGRGEVAGVDRRLGTV